MKLVVLGLSLSSSWGNGHATTFRGLLAEFAARGHDIGNIDGVLGSASREAIKREQSRLGMNADGRAGRKLLEALRAGR